MTLGDLRKVACVVKCQLYLNCGSSNTLHGLFAKTLGGQNFVGKCRSPTEISWEGAHFISRMDQSGFFFFFFLVFVSASHHRITPPDHLLPEGLLVPGEKKGGPPAGIDLYYYLTWLCPGALGDHQFPVRHPRFLTLQPWICPLSS